MKALPSSSGSSEGSRFRIAVPALLAAACIIWSVVLWQLVLRTGGIIVDGVQSIGAVAGAEGPGKLRWPFLGSFLGYDQTWGFHWFGWPWLRSLLLPVLEWSPRNDLALISCLWALAAWCLFRMIARTSNVREAAAAGLFALCGPGLVVVIASYRPEVPTALGLVLLADAWSRESAWARARKLALLAILPSLHPLGFVVPLAWLGASAYLDWRGAGRAAALRRLWPGAAALAIGVAGFFCWYAMQPPAWEQFRTNVVSQRMLVEGLNAGYLTLFRWGLSGMGAIPLLALLVPAVASSIVIGISCLRDPSNWNNKPLMLAAVAVAAGFLFNLVTRNPNPHHFTAVMPFAAWLLANVLGKAVARMRWKLFAPAAGVVLLLFNALPAKQMASLLKGRGTSYRSELTGVLNGLPPARRVLIPVCLWEAAVKQPGSAAKYRFSTFPNILPKQQRREFEEHLFEDSRSGDLLIWDQRQDDEGVFNFVKDVALRHEIIRPKENPGEWERLPDARVGVTYSRSQPSVFEIYRRR